MSIKILNSSKTRKFIDFDKNRRQFYNNLYLDDVKFVIKIPLIREKGEELKVEKFDLTKYTYLLSYD